MRLTKVSKSCRPVDTVAVATSEALFGQECDNRLGSTISTGLRTAAFGVVLPLQALEALCRSP
jgi:hypothetical protein